MQYKRATFRLAVACVIIFVSFASVEELYGQDFRLPGNRVYRLVDGRWYNYSEGSQGDPIVPHRLVVRRADRGQVTRSQIASTEVSGVRVIPNVLFGNYHVLEIDSAVDPFRVADAISADPQFDYVEFDALGRFDAAPNDPQYANQWNLTKINLPAAWNLATGHGSVVLAIIDSGYDYNHLDLDGNVWYNQSEQNGQAGVDDDANGYVDDIQGWDFTACQQETDDCSILGDNDPYPSSGTSAEHGTAVAGIAAAETNNSREIAGVAGGWGNASGIKLMNLRVYLHAGAGSPEPSAVSVAKALQYAAENGAKIANISIGFKDDWSYLEDAVIDASDVYGCLVVASAGNNGGSTPTPGDPYANRIIYPARYTRTLSVGATLKNDARASYSAVGYGDDLPGGEGTLDVMAPGGQDDIYSLALGGGYVSNFGYTSAAAPQAAGLAALMLSINSSLSWSQVKSIIRGTADRNGCVEIDSNYAYVQECGQGRIDAKAALKYIIEKFGATVPLGEAMSLSNETYSFASGKGLTVSGILSANATILTSSTSWEGIYFASGSSGTLDDVTISGTSGTAITINNSSPTVRNSNITSAGKGINVSNGSSFPEIHNNDISTGGMYGVRFYDAGGYLYDNKITGSGNGEGVTAYYFADPLLDEPILGVRGYNEVSGYYWGLRAQLSSTIWTGAGYNCITGTTVDADAMDDGTIYAENNWWGTDGPQISFDESSYIDYTPYLNSDPCGASKAGQTSPTPLATVESGTDLRNQVMDAKRNAIEGRYEEAVRLFKSVVASDAESGAAATALIELGHLCEKMNDSALQSYLQDAAASDTRHAATIKGSLIGCHRAFGDDDRALAAARSLVQNHPGSWQAFYGSLSEFYIHFDAERYGDASAMLESLRPTRESEMEAVSFAHDLLEMETGREGLDKTSDALASIATSGTEGETSLMDAHSYPNPFNPRTAIRFTLSDEMRVRLAVFDLLGRELAVLVDERRDAGHHEVYFDASEYATGTYLYRLSTPHASVSGIMQLVK